MGSALPVVLFAIGGLLAGGCWSMYKQGASKVVVALVGVLSLVAVAGGLLWLVPGRS
ncbi:MAG TPA: hypothetical protein VF054_00900 [Micromonosporaceae bacterium]